MKAIAGAILIHAGCTLMAAGGIVDDLAFVPILFGVALVVADLIADLSKPKAPAGAQKSD